MNDPKQIEKSQELISTGEESNPNPFLDSMTSEAQAFMKKYAIIRLFISIEKRDLAKIKNLMEEWLVDINAKETDNYNKTPLGFAITQGNREEIIDYLLANGADPKLAYNDFKRTADIDGINQLIKIVPDSVPQEVHESKQITTLRLLVATETGDLATIKNLIEKGLVDINNKISFDFAVQENEIIDYLLANGAKDDTIEPLGIVNPEE